MDRPTCQECGGFLLNHLQEKRKLCDFCWDKKQIDIRYFIPFKRIKKTMEIELEEEKSEAKA